MNKRAAILSLLDENTPQEYIPAAFFLHFDPEFHFGQAAVDKHLEYFTYTGMDLVKIQYELRMPETIQSIDDWAKLPLYGKDFYEPVLGVVDGLVKSSKAEAVVVLTLYSAFMLAGQAAGGQEAVTAHLKEDPEKVRKGLEIITESMHILTDECFKLGLDGFYASTQGREVFRFDDKAIFDDYIKPFDQAVLNDIDAKGAFNILHVCDYVGSYADLTPFVPYPGDVVNASLVVDNRLLSPEDLAVLFGRPFMGGLDRHGVLATGPTEAIEKRVLEILGNP